jgi:Arc/MetJ family transcription regulator
MRTNIDIDDRLMKQTMAATRTTTKKAAVEASMRLAVRLKAQEGIRKLRGKVIWRGPDDDWFASDEAVIRARRLAARKTVENDRPSTGKGLLRSAASGQR